MRKTTSLILLLIATLVILVGSTALVSMRGQGQRDLSPKDKAQQKNDFESNFPLAEYAATEPTDARELAKRRSKDNRVPKGRLDEMQDVTETKVVDGKRSDALPALPVALSDIIIVGNVLTGEAYLSSNKTGLFSEFTVNIEEVIKARGSDLVISGANISIEREGGRIRYPSGRIRWVRYAHEGMPSIGRRYVLFLRRSGEENIFTILTGYELRAGLVAPMDGVAAFEERKLPQFAQYDGVAETTFLTTVRASAK